MVAPKTTVATHLEQQVLEVFGELVAAEATELAKTTPAIATQRASVDPDFNAGVVTLSVSLPISYVVDADGGMSFDVTETLPAA